MVHERSEEALEEARTEARIAAEAKRRSEVERWEAEVIRLAREAEWRTETAARQCERDWQAELAVRKKANEGWLAEEKANARQPLEESRATGEAEQHKRAEQVAVEQAAERLTAEAQEARTEAFVQEELEAKCWQLQDERWDIEVQEIHAAEARNAVLQREEAAMLTECKAEERFARDIASLVLACADDASESLAVEDGLLALENSPEAIRTRIAPALPVVLANEFGLCVLQR